MDTQSSGKRVEFTPPKDFKPPEGSSTDKEWDMVCSFRTKEDGSICMTKLGDHAMPGYGEDHDDHDRDRESEHKPDYGRMSSGIMGGMGAAMGGGDDSGGGY